MPLYPIVLFLHIVGALGLFASLGVEWVSLLALRRAETKAEVQFAAGGLNVVRWVGMISLAVILVAGLYMTFTVWKGTPWIAVALLSMLVFPLVGILGGRRLAVLGQALNPQAGMALSPAVRQQLQHPLILASLQIRTAVALGIVFLMTVKPDWAGSIATILTALVLGVASTLPAWNRGRVERRQEV